MPYHLYALFSPGAHQPFYVGATGNPSARQSAHRRRFRADLSLVVMETREDPLEIARLETELIAHYIAQGVPLKNKVLLSYYKGLRHPSKSSTPFGLGKTYSHARREFLTAKWKEKRLKRIARKETLNRLKAESVPAQEAFARAVADGSAARIAAEYLASRT